MSDDMKETQRDETDVVEVKLAKDSSLATRISKNGHLYVLELIESETAEVLSSRSFISLASARAESHRIVEDEPNRTAIEDYLRQALGDDPGLESIPDEDGYLATVPLSRDPYRLLCVRMLPTSLGPSAEEVAVSLFFSSRDGLDDPDDDETGALEAFRGGAVHTEGEWSIFEAPAVAVTFIRKLVGELRAADRNVDR